MICHRRPSAFSMAVDARLLAGLVALPTELRTSGLYVDDLVDKLKANSMPKTRGDLLQGRSEGTGNRTGTFNAGSLDQNA